MQINRVDSCMHVWLNTFCKVVGFPSSSLNRKSYIKIENQKEEEDIIKSKMLQNGREKFPFIVYFLDQIKKGSLVAQNMEKCYGTTFVFLEFH